MKGEGHFCTFSMVKEREKINKPIKYQAQQWIRFTFVNSINEANYVLVEARSSRGLATLRSCKAFRLHTS